MVPVSNMRYVPDPFWMYAKRRVYLKYPIIPNISGFLGFSKDFQNRTGLLSEKCWVAGRDQVPRGHCRSNNDSLLHWFPQKSERKNWKDTQSRHHQGSTISIISRLPVLLPLIGLGSISSRTERATHCQHYRYHCQQEHQHHQHHH